MDSLIDFALKMEYERLQKLGDRLNDIISFIPLLKGGSSISHRRIWEMAQNLDKKS
ncbi:MAG: hypothetical protein RBS85_06655 [Methanofastidiosum sp.]|jgi:hypothetical protein|nr:hypothetical protein [Methanofastidiosum sp.]